MRLLGSVPSVLAAALTVWSVGCVDEPTRPFDPPPPAFDVCDRDPGHEKCGDDPSLIVHLLDREGDNIRSDGRGAYVGEECGVLADFNLGDARLDPDANHRGRVSRTCPDPRALTFEWDRPADGGEPKPTRTDGIFMNIDQVEGESGIDVPHAGQFNVCNRLIFDPDDPYEPDNGSDRLLVSFIGGDPNDPSDDRWTVETQPYPNDKGYCVADGRLWHMSFSLTVERRP